MADSKITALANTNRTVLVPTDLAVVVDVSDTSMASSGTDLNVSLAEFVASGAIGALGVAAGVGARFYMTT